MISCVPPVATVHFFNGFLNLVSQNIPCLMAAAAPWCHLIRQHPVWMFKEDHCSNHANARITSRMGGAFQINM